VTATLTGRSAPARSRRRGPGILGTAALLLVVGYLVVVPLVRLQALAVADGGSAWETAWSADGVGGVVATTVALALGSLVIAMVLGTGLAALAVRLPPRWRWLSVVPILPIVIPAVASVTGWAFLFAPRAGYLNALLRMLPFVPSADGSGPVDVYTVPWIVIVTGIGLSAFPYVFVRTGLLNLDHHLTEAAQAAGSSPWRVLFRVQLPLLRPVLVYGGGIALLLGLGQFTAPLLLGTANGVEVLTTRMYTYAAEPPTDFGAAAAVGSPLLLLGVAVVLAQRAALGDESRFVTHGGKSRAVGRPVRWAPWPIAVYGVFAVLLPLLALVAVALSPFYSSTISPGSFTLVNFTRLFATPFVLESIGTSLLTSVAGVALALPLGYLVATVVHARRRPWLCRVLDLVVNLPLGVPAVIFGAGFLFTYTRPPLVLYGTDWVIILVYVTLMLPYASRMLLAARLALGDDYVAASRAAGAGPLRTHLQTILPLMRPAIGGAAALMFVLLTHEFSASLLVRSGTTQVMGTKLYDLWSGGSYPQVAAMALVMTGITAAGVVAAALVGGGNPLEKL
jgi:iron(III) transport system permease protein